jgi:hypothetical protein
MRDLKPPPVDPVWWVALPKAALMPEVHIKTRLWVDALRLASEALGLPPEDVYLRLESEIE